MSAFSDFLNDRPTTASLIYFWFLFTVEIAFDRENWNFWLVSSPHRSLRNYLGTAQRGPSRIYSVEMTVFFAFLTLNIKDKVIFIFQTEYLLVLFWGYLWRDVAERYQSQFETLSLAMSRLIHIVSSVQQKC